MELFPTTSTGHLESSWVGRAKVIIYIFRILLVFESWLGPIPHLLLFFRWVQPSVAPAVALGTPAGRLAAGPTSALTSCTGAIRVVFRLSRGEGTPGL
jgi:hypothetical protein